MRWGEIIRRADYSCGLFGAAVSAHPNEPSYCYSMHLIEVCDKVQSVIVKHSMSQELIKGLVMIMLKRLKAYHI